MVMIYLPDRQIEPNAKWKEKKRNNFTWLNANKKCTVSNVYRVWRLSHILVGQFASVTRYGACNTWTKAELNLTAHRDDRCLSKLKKKRKFISKKKVK